MQASIVEALRHDLTKKRDAPTPVFPFGYDWRQDCGRSAVELAQFIGEVLARTALLPHYRKDKPTKVDLVGHSMGGLVVAKYLRDQQDAGTPTDAVPVRRVVTIGTPFRGSIEAVRKLTTGLGSIGGESPRSREREAARTFPSIYQLLPSYEGAVQPHENAGVEGDIF